MRVTEVEVSISNSRWEITRIIAPAAACAESNCAIVASEISSTDAVGSSRMMIGADVDGVLVGGASLDPEEFARIAKYHRVATTA